MKATQRFLKQAVYSVGIATLLVPVLAVVNPTVGAPTNSRIVAQNTSGSLRTFRSSSLGFRISFPSSYTVDRSSEAQGTVRLARSQSAPTASQPGTTPEVQPGNKSQSNVGAGSVVISAFENPKRLSAMDWAKQNDAQSYFVSGRQSNYRSSKFAGQPAIAYSWCASECGDSVVFPSRDGKKMIVLSAIYDYPGDSVRWDFQNIAGKFQFAK